MVTNEFISTDVLYVTLFIDVLTRSIVAYLLYMHGKQVGRKEERRRAREKRRIN